MPISVSEVETIKRLDDRAFALFNAEAARNQKSVGIAYLLWFFFGWLGVHKLYLGNRIGYLYLVAAVSPFMVLVRMISAVSNHQSATSTDGLAVVLAVLGLVFLAVALVVDMFTIPAQVENANRFTRLSLLERLEYLTSPPKELDAEISE